MAVEYIYRFTMSRVLTVVSIIFYSLNPVVSVFSFSTCKNILFSACLLMLTCSLWEQCNGGEVFGKILAFSFLGCLLLNNFPYALVAYLFIIIVFNRKLSKCYAIPVAFSLLLFFLISNFLYPALNIEKGPDKEMLSVPLQQIVHACEYGDLSPEEINHVRSFFIDNDYYYFQYGNADMIKTRFNENDYENRKKEFYKMYFRIVSEEPVGSIYSFLRLNFPLWSPMGIDICDYTMTDYIETDTYEIPIEGFTGFERMSFFPKLLEIYESFTSYSMIKDHPVLRFIFGASLPFIIFLICFIKLVYSGLKEKILIFLPYLFLVITHLFGPLSNMRYAFPGIVLIPVMISVAFADKAELKNEKSFIFDNGNELSD